MVFPGSGMATIEPVETLYWSVRLVTDNIIEDVQNENCDWANIGS